MKCTKAEGLEWIFPQVLEAEKKDTTSRKDHFMKDQKEKNKRIAADGRTLWKNQIGGKIKEEKIILKNLFTEKKGIGKKERGHPNLIKVFQLNFFFFRTQYNPLTFVF